VDQESSSGDRVFVILQEHLVGISLRQPVVVRPPVGQDPQGRQIVILEEGLNTVIKKVCRGDRDLCLVELRESYALVGVHDYLLANPPYSLEITDIVRVLGRISS
jgi:hypothetical protein